MCAELYVMSVSQKFKNIIANHHPAAASCLAKYIITIRIDVCTIRVVFFNSALYALDVLFLDRLATGRCHYIIQYL